MLIQINIHDSSYLLPIFYTSTEVKYDYTFNVNHTHDSSLTFNNPSLLAFAPKQHQQAKIFKNNLIPNIVLFLKFPFRVPAHGTNTHRLNRRSVVIKRL